MAGFKDAKKLIKLQSQAKNMQKKLGNIHIEAEDGGVTITFDGNMAVLSTIISDDAMAKGTGHLENSVTSAIRKGLKKAQEVAASNMKEIMGGLGLPSELPGM